MLVVGWSVTEHDKLELDGEGAADGSNVRAAGLILFSLFYASAWPASIKWIYRSFFEGQPHEGTLDRTLLPRKIAMRYCWSLSICLVVTAVLMSVQ